MEEAKSSGGRPPADVVLNRKISVGNEVFASIQTKLRSCPAGVAKVVAFFEGIISVSANKDKEKREKIKIKKFLDMITSELAVTFDVIEVSYFHKRFCFLDDIDVSKLYTALDMGRPETHTDPDYFTDKLPQPYRLISKIIEMEILDKAWLEITRIHPEYLLGSDGKPIFVPKSQRLQYVTKPVSEKVFEFMSLRAAPVGNYVFGTSANGEFIALDSSTDQVASSIQAIGGDIPGSPPMLSPLKIINVTEPSKKKRVVRVLLVCKSQIEELKKVEEVVVDPKAKGKKPAVEEPKMEMKNIVLMTVVEVCLAPTKTGFRGPAMRIVARAKVDLPEADNIDTIGADIALDGSLLCAGISTGFTLFELTDMKRSNIDSMTSTAAVDPIDEESKEDLSATPRSITAPVEYLTPVLVSNDYVSENAMEPLPAANMACRSCHLVEIKEEDDNISKCANPLYNMEGMREEDIYPPEAQLCRFSLILLFDVCNYWLAFTFLKNPRLEEEGEGDDALVSCTNWEDAKYDYTICHRHKTNHMNAITASCMSEGNILLGLGYQDGSVTLHQAVDKAFISCPCQHACPVTSTCIAYNPHSKHYTLISGALDGSVVFTRIEVAVPLTQETWGYCQRPETLPLQVFLAAAERNEGLGNVPTPCADVRCHRIDDRADVPGAYVSSIHHMRESPIAVIHYSNGIIGAYDVETGSVLGKLVLYFGSKAKEYNFRPYVNGDAGDIFEKKTPLPVERPTPAVPSDKYSMKDSDEKWSMHKDSISVTNNHKILAASPPGKFQITYVRNGTPILVSYSLDAIMRELYPGIVSLAKGRAEPYPLKDLLLTLTGPQRMDAELSIESVPELLSQFYALPGSAEGSIAGSSNPSSRGPSSAQNSNPPSRNGSVSQLGLGVADPPPPLHSTSSSTTCSRGGTSSGTYRLGLARGASSKPGSSKAKARPDPSVLSTKVDSDMECIFRTPLRSIVWEDRMDMRRVNWTLEQEAAQNAQGRAKSYAPFMKEMQRQVEEVEGKEELLKAATEAEASMRK